MISVTATDDDNGTSAPFSTTSLSAYDASFRQPISAGVYNSVPKGYVIPVKITVGCAGTFNSSLSPAIQIYTGDGDPATDPSDPTYVVTSSASSADSGTTMRLADGQYIYNLQVPFNTSVGQLYTVAVWPFGKSNAAVMRAVLKIRK